MAAKPMLGEVELQLVQKIDTEGDQVLAEHGVPGLEGDFLQGLGRRAERLTLNGVLTGPEAGDGLKTLREKFRAAEPVSFVADIATATKVGKVFIEEMGVRDLAGKPERFEYAFALREFLPPPPAKTEDPPPGPVDPETPDLPSVERATLVVEVIVEDQPEFDFSTMNVTLDGKQDDGVPQSRNLVNHTEGTWTETEMPPGQYTVRAVVTEPEAMSGEVAAAVRGGQTTRVQVTLRPGAIVAKAFIVHFQFDCAFVEPCMFGVLGDVFERAQANPTEKILVVGHTDLTGGPELNQSLSERRARSVFALLTFGTSPALRKAGLEDWKSLRQERLTPDTVPSMNDTWGAREYQYMLQELEFYSGNIDGDHGPITDAAIRAFQQDNGLPLTGLMDDATWPVLIEAYLDAGTVGLGEDRFFPNAKEGCDGGILKWLGCGEQDPVKNTQKPWRPNRRTEILFVRDKKLPRDVPPPDTFDLPAPGAVSPTWCLGPGDVDKRAGFSTRTQQEPNKWLIQPAEPDKVIVSGNITFDDGTPFAKRKYILIAPDGEFLHTDSAGKPDSAEHEKAPKSGRPIEGLTDARGNFSYPLQTPAGIYILELPKLEEPTVARGANEPPQEAIGNVICLRLKPSPPAV